MTMTCWECAGAVEPMHGADAVGADALADGECEAMAKAASATAAPAAARRARESLMVTGHRRAAGRPSSPACVMSAPQPAVSGRRGLGVQDDAVVHAAA